LFNLFKETNLPIKKANCSYSHTHLAYKKEELPVEKHPIQPVEMVNGIARFKENKIVRHLLDKCTEAGICDLNNIAFLASEGKFNNEDQEQLAQLIGYSVSAAGGLSFMSEQVTKFADKEVENLIKEPVEEEPTI